ncbi:argonaute/piwi family protein [Roseivivax sp. CAU 1761]
MAARRKRSVKTNRKLLPIREPRLLFAHDQKLDDPKDGLLLFGPPKDHPAIEYGVIGTPEGIAQFKAWAGKIAGAIEADPKVGSSVMFPGFETVFRTEWRTEPRVALPLDAAELDRTIRNTDAHQRVYDTVDLFAGRIRRWVEEEDAKVALWFVVVPEELWKLCRPNQTISKAAGVTGDTALSHRKAMRLWDSPDLFDDINEAAEKHRFENHFHNQLKARLLGCEAVTQIVRQTTIAPGEHLNSIGKPIRNVQDDATIAWNLSTAIYYKSGAKPWTLADIREGVCYIGLVFKRTNSPRDEYEACCGAQMFLHTGEGIVFKGSVGSWASDRPGEFHLPKDQAADIVRRCVDSYRNWHGEAPKELFIHGRTNFNREEIEGFREGAPEGTKVSGIQIKRPNDLKLFREEGKRGVMRGLSLKVDHRNAFLWSSGYVPKLKTYPGREIPTPLKVKIVFGDTPIEQVLEDILSLTKLNFNTCIYSDGYPVTLRFADDVGEILTAIPEVSSKPLPFRHYI